MLLDPDPFLRRVERNAGAYCAAVALTAWVVRQGNPDVAFGVVGGVVLMGTSYWAIRSSVTALVAFASRAPERGGSEEADEGGAPLPPGPGSVLFRLVGRYALLGLLAYVMIARLRLHPVGLLLGVSSLFAAAMVEAVRATRQIETRPRR